MNGFFGAKVKEQRIKNCKNVEIPVNFVKINFTNIALSETKIVFDKIILFTVFKFLANKVLKIQRIIS